MNEKKLFMREPLIWTTPTYGDLFSVTDDRILPWVYNNFIQLGYSHEWRVFIFEDHHFLLNSCPALKSYYIPEDFIKGYTLHNLVVEMINRNCYILLWVDRYYLPCYKEYEVNHVNHEIFMYGYDMRTDRIYFADNLSDGKYKNVFCTSRQFEAAYYAVDRINDFIKDIFLYRKRNKYECFLNREQIMDGLRRYLYSKKVFIATQCGNKV